MGLLPLVFGKVEMGQKSFGNVIHLKEMRWNSVPLLFPVISSGRRLFKQPLKMVIWYKTMESVDFGANKRLFFLYDHPVLKQMELSNSAKTLFIALEWPLNNAEQ